MAIEMRTDHACFICGEPATVEERKSSVDFDCSSCGRLRVTGRALFVFPPQAMRSFDRPWLSSKVRAITETPQDGNRKLVNEYWLHHWRLVTLLMVDHSITEAEAQAELARYPDADPTTEIVLDLIARDIAKR